MAATPSTGSKPRFKISLFDRSSAARAEHRDRRGPARAPRTLATANARWLELGASWLSIAALLIVVGLSLADGLLGDSVAYERDTTVFYFPLMRWVAQQLHQGVFPLWTPQVFGGYPIFADGEIGLSYPPALLALLVLPAERAFVFLRLLHLCLAAVGMFALARVWGLPRTSAVLAGVVFTLGNFLQAQIHHENIVRTASWLPLMLALVELGLREKSWPRRSQWTVLAGLALGMAGLGLHSQMLAIDLLVLAAYGAFRWWAGPLGGADVAAVGGVAHGTDGSAGPDGATGIVGAPGGAANAGAAEALGAAGSAGSPGSVGAVGSAGATGSAGTAPALTGRAAPRSRVWLRRLLAVARVSLPVVVLGLCLAGVQLVPLLELAGFSTRGSGIPYSESAAYSLTTFGLAQLILPFIFRGPGNLQWGLWTHWESYLYVGLAPLFLAAVAVAVVRGRDVAGWAVLAGVATLVSLGQYSPINLHYLLWLLPGLSGLRAPGRFTIVVILAVAMLAAYGLAALQHGRVGRTAGRRMARVAAISALCVVAVVLGGHIALQLWPGAAQAAVGAVYLSQPRDTYPLSASDVYDGLMWATDLSNPRVVGALLGVVLVATLLVARLAVRRTWRGWPTLLVGLTVLDLLAFAWGIHPRASLAQLASEPRAIGVLEHSAAQSTEPLRVLASPILNQVSADRLAPLGLQEANGYSSLQFIWHRDYLGRVLEVDDDLLDLWNVRYVVDPARLGVVPRYGGVDFMPGQAMLHAPAGGAAAQETFNLTPGSKVRELRLVSAMMGAVEIDQDTPVANLVLRDADGQLVAQTQLLAGRDTMEWAWDVPSAQPFVRHQRVEVAGLVFEGGASSTPRLLSFAAKPLAEPVAAATLSIESVLPRGELAVYGAEILTTDGSTQQLFGRTKTKYRPVYRDAEMQIFENTEALPRAFLVNQARWSPSIGATLGEMIHRPFQPRQEVILAADSSPDITAQLVEGGSAAAIGGAESGTAAGGAAGAGTAMGGAAGPGTATIEAYADNEVRVATTSLTPALLVLSDTYYPGWRAFVDGGEQPLVRGDLLFRVVPVPAGQHQVIFRFEPTSIRLGLAISLAALLCAIGVLVAASRAQARSRTTSGTPEALESEADEESAGGYPH